MCWVVAHANINRYKADLRETRFVLFEQFRAGELLGKPPFENWGVDEVNMVLDEVYRYATEVSGPLNGISDEGCRIVDGTVTTPPGFKEAWKKLYESGFKSLSIEPEFGGQGALATVTAMVTEMTSGSCTAFDMYPGLTIGAAELIASFGGPGQAERYCPKMHDGTWSGTMCITEPHAGSDVGDSKTTAKQNDDGTYSIKGTKIFISGGDHDLTENIVHMVLARIEGAPIGTKGLSLFIVPKRRIDEEGNSGDSNDVTTLGIEHKMGINGSATAQLSFGENDGCIGELCGTEPHRGMRQMFQMMNFARIGVGIQGLAIASAAYLSAVEYAKERKQGASVTNWKDPAAPRVPIIQHPNVRRMLLDMKARVEGIRALIVKGAWHRDHAVAIGDSDEKLRQYHEGQLELMTPLIKAYSSDQAFSICETAIQVHGGVGYTADFPVEQYCRDSKIFSIYEGTNGIQALDLVGRKLGQAGGANMQAFLGDVQKFIDETKDHADLGPAVAKLAAAHAAVASTAMTFLTWFQEGKMDRVPLAANRFLDMMSEFTVGWLLLDGAKISIEKQKSVDKKDADWAFYEGKKHAACFFASHVLPNVPSSASVIADANSSALEIPEAAFTTV